MSLRDRTKKLFADTLKDMLREMPMEKVRINELCRRCGADRQTFYYHFKDKYDLATWIFARDYESALTDTSGQYTIEHAASILRRMHDDKIFTGRYSLTDPRMQSVLTFMNTLSNWARMRCARNSEKAPLTPTPFMR